MPCWEVNVMSIELKAADRDLLAAALNDMGVKFVREPSGDFNLPFEGIQIGRDSVQCRPKHQGLVNRIKQAYSRQIVRKAAKYFKWTVTAKSDGKLVVRRY